MHRVRYPPLSEYGFIGNMVTCSLVNRYGSIDWCPMPHIASPSVFAAILDNEYGGYFQVQPAQPYQAAQRYIDETNVLATDYHAPTGKATLLDWMAFPDDSRTDSAASVIYRKVTCTTGTVQVSVDFQPRFDYARVVPDLSPTDQGVVAHNENTELYLTMPSSLSLSDDAATATVSLTENEAAWFVLGYDRNISYDPETFQRRLDQTIGAWRAWLDQGGRQSQRIDEGRWRSLVDRSALTLKLLTHYGTGAIAAAPTTSLPEEMGGVRNWDYRYNWIRDAAFTVQALSKLGYVSEAKAYFSWLLDKVYQDPSSLRPLYGLHGGRTPEEQTLDHLRGYRSSAPVRIGNAAKHQRQLDIYGELVLAVYETSRFGEAITSSNWDALRNIIDYVSDIWNEPDAGIWEVRTEPRHFVHSKVMCWTALDRGLKFIKETDFQGPVKSWQQARQDIRDAILKRGYSDTLGSFVQTFETSDALDATALLIPLVGFLPFDDPRVQGTIEAVQHRLMTEEGLVYRYENGDGLPGGEGTFVLCSFWLVNALALSGRVDEAESLFDTIVSHTSPLGLLSEEIAMESGELLGNYPQAFSHIGLINSVLYLDRVHQDRQPGPEPLGSEPDQSTDLTLGMHD